MTREPYQAAGMSSELRRHRPVAADQVGRAVGVGLHGGVVCRLSLLPITRDYRKQESGWGERGACGGRPLRRATASSRAAPSRRSKGRPWRRVRRRAAGRRARGYARPWVRWRCARLTWSTTSCPILQTQLKKKQSENYKL